MRSPNGANGSAYKILLIFGLFFIGTYNTVITKVLFTAQSIGKDGKPELFLKPAFGNWTMFLGMMFSLIAYRFKSRRTLLAEDNGAGAGQALLEKPQTFSRNSYLLVGIPASFDLVAMGLSLVGIILIPASIWQMLRGAQIVFAALFTRVFLRRELCGFHWLGVVIAVLGVGVVSWATVQGNEDNSSTTNSATHLVLIGILVTLFSQVITAAQIIVEERLLTDVKMDPMLICGLEGCWGFFLMSFIVYPLLWLLPGADHGHAEDVVDTYYLVKNSGLVLFIAVADAVSCLMYNIICLKMTESFTGVFRTMLEATKTLTVWLFNLVWHYCVNPNSRFGEPWNMWSYLELVGFLLLLLGQVTYSAKLKWPGFSYPPESAEMVETSPVAFASPIAMRTGVLASPVPTGYSTTIVKDVSGL